MAHQPPATTRNKRKSCILRKCRITMVVFTDHTTTPDECPALSGIMVRYFISDGVSTLGTIIKIPPLVTRHLKYR